MYKEEVNIKASSGCPKLQPSTCWDLDQTKPPSLLVWLRFQ